MNTGFSELLDGLARKARIGTILQIGQGDAAAALATGAAAVVAALPGPLAGADLQALAAAEPRLVLHRAAVAAQPGQAQFQLFNFAALSGFSAPAPALKELYPGLSVTARPEVELMALNQLIEAMPQNPQGAEVLILDQPGSEAQLLEALLDGPAAERFAHVLLRAGVEALYADSRPLPDLTARLEAAGYRIDGQALDDPDLPIMHFRLEPLTLELRRVREQAQALTTERDSLTTALDTRSVERDEARERVKALITERDEAREQVKALATERDKAREQAQALTAECENAREQAQALTAERDKAREQVKALTTERDRAREQARKAEEKAARTAAQLRLDTTRLQADLDRQTAVNCRLQDEFRRIEAQMDLLRSLVAPLALGSAGIPRHSETIASPTAEPRPSSVASGAAVGRGRRRTRD